MGKIADDMVNGLCCSECGVCFEHEHGFPVLCKGCYDNDWECSVPEATISEL